MPRKGDVEDILPLSLRGTSSFVLIHASSSRACLRSSQRCPFVAFEVAKFEYFVFHASLYSRWIPRGGIDNMTPWHRGTDDTLPLQGQPQGGATRGLSRPFSLARTPCNLGHLAEPSPETSLGGQHPSYTTCVHPTACSCWWAR